MELQLEPELQARLNELAAQEGKDPATLVREAIERLVSYDEWFLREVDKGIAAANRGEFIEHEEVAERIERLLQEKKEQQKSK